MVCVFENPTDFIIDPAGPASPTSHLQLFIPRREQPVQHRVCIPHSIIEISLGGVGRCHSTNTIGNEYLRIIPIVIHVISPRMLCVQVYCFYLWL